MHVDDGKRGLVLATAASNLHDHVKISPEKKFGRGDVVVTKLACAMTSSGTKPWGLVFVQNLPKQLCSSTPEGSRLNAVRVLLPCVARTLFSFETSEKRSVRQTNFGKFPPPCS